MNITVVCAHCGNHDKDPNIEINFKEGTIYYVCPECKNDNSILLKLEAKPYPKIRKI